MDKCQTCSNEYSCTTYRYCPNQFQQLSSSGQCSFYCQTGYHISQTTCGTCSDTNCLQCWMVNSTYNQCGRCSAGYYLDLSTYTCVQTCPTMTFAINSTNVINYSGTNIAYCRPYSYSVNNYTYYINPNSSSYFGLGTLEHPFMSIDSPAKEIFNFMYTNYPNVTVYLARNTSISMYSQVSPIILVKLHQYSLLASGDSSLPNPIIYIRNNPIQYPDSLLFRLSESTYNFTLRSSLGDLTSLTTTLSNYYEITTSYSSLNITNVDVQSIQLLSKSLLQYYIAIYNGQNQTVTYNGGYIELDGYFVFSLASITSGHFINLNINGTNMINLFYFASTQTCTSIYDQNLDNWFIIENSTFSLGISSRQSSAPFSLSIIGDITIRNVSVSNIVTSTGTSNPFYYIYPNAVCAPSTRKKKILMELNTFSNMPTIFNRIDYSTSSNPNIQFVFQNNTVVNTTFTQNFMNLASLQSMSVTIQNNVYQNVTFTNGISMLYFDSLASNITIYNEKIKNCTIDDFYIIHNANNTNITGVNISSITNSNTVSSSAVINIANVANYAYVTNLNVKKSTFVYVTALSIVGAQAVINTANITNNTLTYSSIFYLTSTHNLNISSLTISSNSKASSSSLFFLNIASLSFVQYESFYSLSSIQFSDSYISLMEVQSVSASNPSDSSNYSFELSNITITNVQESNFDPMIKFSTFIYKGFNVVIDSLNVNSNILASGPIIYVSMNSQQLLISNSTFTNNSGQFLYLVSGYPSVTSNPMIVYLQNLNFTQNYAGKNALMYMTTNTELVVTNTIFVENYSIGRGSILLTDYENGLAYFSSCTFLRNYAYQGGVFYSQFNSSISVTNSLIQNNFAITGGVAFINNNGVINFNAGTQIIQNYAICNSIIYMTFSKYASTFNNASITRNDQANTIFNKDLFLSQTAQWNFLQLAFINSMKSISDKIQIQVNSKKDYAIFLMMSKMSIINTQIYDNDVLIGAQSTSTLLFTNSTITNISASDTIISLTQSTMTFSNSNFFNFTQNQQSSFYFISIIQSSTFTMSNVIINDITGPLMQATYSTLASTESLITSISNSDAINNMFYVYECEVTFNTTNFTELSQDQSLAFFYFDSNELSLNSVSISGFNQQLFYIESGTYSFDGLIVSQFEVQATQSNIFNSIVLEIYDSNITLQNSLIRDIYTYSSSPVIYIYQSESDMVQQNLILSNSHFINNSATLNGGVATIVNTNISVTNCSFDSNQAVVEGGVFDLSCQGTVYPCLYNISDSNFTNNKAGQKGGALSYNYYAPQLNGLNIFENNSAFYGNDIGAYAITLDLILNENSQNRTTQLTLKEIAELDYVTPANSLVYKLNTSLNSGQALAESIYLNLVDSMNQIVISDSTSQSTLKGYSENTQITSHSTVTAVDGLITFDNSVVIGPPGTNILLQIFLNSITDTQIQEVYPQIGSVANIFVEAYMQICVRGEYQSSDYTCQSCPTKFYSLFQNQTSCQSCPADASCLGGDDITVNKGYWRKDINSTSLFACLNTDSCPSNNNISCATGYGGNLCSVCQEVNDTWYYRVGMSTCDKCEDHKTNSLKLLGISALVVCYIVLLILLLLKQGGQENFKITYIRILTNYFQFLTIASSYELSWGQTIVNFITDISYITQGPGIILSVDCFIREKGYTLEPFYIKLVLSCIFPVFAILISTAIWYPLKLCVKKMNPHKNMVLTSIVIIFISIPPIASITIPIFNCVEYFDDGVQYLAMNLDTVCWVGDHEYYGYRVGLLAILVWLLVAPVVAFVILCKHKKQFREEFFVERYGFLYSGLKPACYYWETVLLLKKLILIVISSFLFTESNVYRGTLALICLLLYNRILEEVKPYKHRNQQNLDQISNYSTASIFCGGLLLGSNSSLSSVPTAFIYTAMGIMNLWFWLYFLKLIFSHQYSSAKYFILKLCCKRNYKPKISKQEPVKLDELYKEQKEPNDKITPQDGNNPAGLDDTKAILLDNASDSMIKQQSQQIDNSNIKSILKRPKKKKEEKKNDNDTTAVQRLTPSRDQEADQTKLIEDIQVPHIEKSELEINYIENKGQDQQKKTNIFASSSSVYKEHQKRMMNEKIEIAQSLQGEKQVQQIAKQPLKEDSQSKDIVQLNQPVQAKESTRFQVESIEDMNAEFKGKALVEIVKAKGKDPSKKKSRNEQMEEKVHRAFSKQKDQSINPPSKDQWKLEQHEVMTHTIKYKKDKMKHKSRNKQLVETHIEVDQRMAVTAQVNKVDQNNQSEAWKNNFIQSFNQDKSQDTPSKKQYIKKSKTRMVQQLDSDADETTERQLIDKIGIANQSEQRLVFQNAKEENKGREEAQDQSHKNDPKPHKKVISKQFDNNVEVIIEESSSKNNESDITDKQLPRKNN